MSQFLSIVFLLFIFSPSAFSQFNFVEIPLNPKERTASTDLLYQGRVLGREEARGLGIDLSRLDPVDSGIWKNDETQSLDIDKGLIDLESSEEVSFESHLTSNNGVFRFNVLTRQGRITTLYLSRTLHSTLIRKNFLRKLGYQIPAIKYLPSIMLNFQSEDEKKQFLEKLRLDAVADSRRWVVKNEGNSLVLRDLAAMILGEGVLYNLAMGVPGGDLQERPLRAVVLAYAICHLEESVNRFSWKVGQIDGGKYVLPNFFPFNSFSTTSVDDLKWLARKIASLDVRKDLWDIVHKSDFPKEVSAIIYQKLVSRRYDVLKKLGVSPREKKEQPINYKISLPPHLKEGKILKISWRNEGYASNFASGDAEGPFKDFQYYVLSILQSNIIGNLINRANKELSVFDPNKARLDLAEKQFKQGLDHYVKTGEFLQFPVSAWYSPSLSGGVILSRDIVVGNYLGTDNLVQLADTFGYSASLGMISGIENVDYIQDLLIHGGVSYVKTFTHLKPIVDLKNAFKENYQNMIVRFYMHKFRKELDKIVKEEANLDNADKGSIKKRQEYLEEVVRVLSKYLGVGESLLITQKITPNLGGRLKAPLYGAGFVFDLSLSGNQVGVKRYQIYRKDPKTIQIYDDKGKAFGFNLGASLKYFIPVVRYQRRSLKGNYLVHSYSLNIDNNLGSNPDFFKNASALVALLKNGSMEVLKELQEPVEIGGDFQDRSDKFSFLFFKHKGLKSYTNYNLETPAALKDEYVSYRNTTRKGLDWEMFIKDIITFQLAKISKDLSWANNIWGDPSATLGGSGETFQTSFEAQVKDEKVTKKYIALTKRFEGWKKQSSSIVELASNFNKRFELPLFNLKEVELAGALALYDFYTTIHIYNEGVERLKNIRPLRLLSLENALKRDPLVCESGKSKKYKLKNKEVVEVCYENTVLTDHLLACKRKEFKKKPLKKVLKCWSQFAKNLFNKIPFKQFASLVGGDNFYLYGEINGFRKDSEELRKPIKSKGYGRVNPLYPYGITTQARSRLGIQRGEFEGYWIRERP